MLKSLYHIISIPKQLTTVLIVLSLHKPCFIFNDTECLYIWQNLYHIDCTWMEIEFHFFLIDNLMSSVAFQKPVFIELKGHPVPSSSDKISIKPRETYATSISDIINLAD